MSSSSVTAPPLRFSTKVLYALGAMGTSMKLTTIGTFLVIYYNQVLGVDPAIVGSMVALTVFIDAFFDPIVGQISDNFRSRWGRRHPFMLAAAIPYAISFFMLWNPPEGIAHGALGVYLLVCLLSVRFFDTFFELPHQALAPELAKEYDERTRLYAIRTFFSTVGTLSLSVLAYQVFLKENADGSGGIISGEGYFALSLTVAIFVFCAILISTFGTLNRVPHLSAPPVRTIGLIEMGREIGQTLKNRLFVITTFIGMMWAIAGGAKTGFNVYFNVYFWEMKQSQMAVLAGITALGGVIGVAMAPFVVRWIGKKWGVLATAIIAAIIHLSPISLRLLGLAPENNTPELLVLLYGEEILNAIFAVCCGVIMASILADVVEDAEVKTGRRSEGLLLSAANVFRKSVSGVGIIIATSVLAAVHFPKGAQRGQVDADILFAMGMGYVPLAAVLFSLGFIGIACLPITRRKHEENLRVLAERTAPPTTARPHPAPGE